MRNGGKLTLVTANATLELELETNDLRAANYRAEESRDGGEVRSLDTAATVRTFKGTVRGKEHSNARFTIDDTTLEGLILIDGEKYFVEKKQKYASTAAPTEFLFYKESDVIESSPASCGASIGEKMKQVGEVVSPMGSGNSLGAQDVVGTLPLDRDIKLATEADYEYVSALGSSESANDEILSILNLIEGVYQNELGLSFNVVYQHTWATAADPYNSATPGTALAEFKNYWNANFTNVSRDTAHLWTGKNLDGDVIGSAEIGAVCLTPSKAYGLSQLLFETDIKVGVTAHELGHNLGATHPDQDPAAPNCANTIMQSLVGYSRSFCPYSREQIANYVSANASCLARTFSIDGNITSAAHLGDVVLNLTGPKSKTYLIKVFTGSTGFTLRGLTPGTYTLSASGPFQVFTPASRTITITDGNVTGADFASTLVQFKIGGRLADANNVGIEGVTVSISTPAAFLSQTTSDANGNYQFEVPATRDYSITPYSPDGNFTPVATTISTLTEDRLNVNFVGTMRPKPTPTPIPTPTPTPIPGLSGAIAFESDWQGQTNLHVIDANGSNEAVLVNNVFHGSSPRWSPDGARLAFVKDGGIYLANADGSNLRKLSAAQVLEGSPNWSSDGKRIMYASGFFLIVSDTNGVIQTQLRLEHAGFSWSPDGSKIAYVTNDQTSSKIHVINVDGTGQATLTSGAGSFTEPEWSPDGTKLVFARGEDRNIVAQILVMNADGSRLTSLTSMAGGTQTPTWSPDGTKIAFSRAGVIYVMNADGSNETRVTNNGRYNTHPAWKAGAASLPSPTPTPSPTSTPPTTPPMLFLNVGATGTYTVGEGDGRLVIKVLRAGDLSSPVSVGFKTNDSDASAPCSYHSGTAYERCDYATTVETLRFEAGETEKTITIPIIDDAYVEGQELMHVQLFSPVGGGMGAANHAFVSIVDNDMAPFQNPALSTPFFVRQHYLDFLSREPEAGEPWSGVLNGCANPFNLDPKHPAAACDRLIVSQSFFGSPEFRLKGFYAFNFYRVAFNRRPEYAEIIPDMRGMAGATTEEVYRKRAAFPVSFTARAEFTQLYAALSDAAFVNTLMDRYGLQQITTPAPENPEGGMKVTLTRSELASRLGATGAQALTRAQVLRAIVESNEVGAAEYNGAFVAMQYYGYLRRTPEESGYQAWLRVINQDPNNVRIMVNGFLNSTEYRMRFGQP